MTINYIKVKNVSRVTNSTPSDGSQNWLDFWKNKNPFYAPSSCSNRNCSTQTDLLGAHVKVPAGETDRQYIVPLCTACTQLLGEFEVPEYKLTPTDH